MRKTVEEEKLTQPSGFGAGRPHKAKIGRSMVQKYTGVETTYGKVQHETNTCQIDRQPRQDCGESLGAGGIRPVTVKSIGEAYVAVDSNRLI